MNDVAIVWFRADLRVLDNPALFFACKNHKKIIPLYIYDDEIGGDFSIGSASKWWLHHSLESLSKSLPLVIKIGEASKIIADLVDAHDVRAVYWNRCYEKFSIERDKSIKEILKDKEVHCESFNGSLLFEPWEIKTKQGGSYGVFTPFWRACMERGYDNKIIPEPKVNVFEGVASDSLNSLKLLPTKPDWSKGISNSWEVGEQAASKILDEFLNNELKNYSEGRNIPSKPYTSRLSPYLAFGEISPSYIYNTVKSFVIKNKHLDGDVNKFLSELGWREFSYHLIYYFPDMAEKNFKDHFQNFAWSQDKDLLEKWQKGMTGYPIVDAGMRELWHTGYMHNRVRMIVASFLIKDLFIDWREGEKWFWDTLVDADFANNSCSWQWVAGCGADAAPYFRVFNPILQGEKFDLEGEYVKKWVPELKDVPKKYIHKPWEMPKDILSKPVVELGKDYPKPIVDHSSRRKLFLELMKKN